jgi:hypothetical protein
MADKTNRWRQHTPDRKRENAVPPLLSEVAFSFAYELVGLLKREHRPDLAVLVADLRIMDVQDDDDPICSIVHTTRRRTRWGFGRRETIGLLPRHGTINVDLIEGKIVSITTFDRPDLAEALVRAA